jgi:chromate reductase
MLVLGISGSLRGDSFNTALLRAAAAFLPAAARMSLLTDLALVPPYSEEGDIEPAPAPVERLRSRIDAADALLIATPEYNGSIPGQLKNAVDWASRPYPDNALRQKPVAVIGASTGVFGAIWAQAELRKVLTTAGADVLDDELPIGTAEEAFADDLTLADRELSRRLEHILRDLMTRATVEPRRGVEKLTLRSPRPREGRQRPPSPPGPPLVSRALRWSPSRRWRG